MPRQLLSLAVASLLCGAGCTPGDNCPPNVESFVQYADGDGGLPSCAESCPGGHRALYGCQFLGVDMAVRYAHVRCNLGPCPANNSGGVEH